MLLLTRCANRQVTLSVQGVDRKRDEYKGCGGTIHMEKTNEKYGAYIQILREELIPAMGCTEPIAVAYAAAVARQTLGELPDKVIVGASGSIIKNVKSVIVPNTDNMKGLNTAAAAGIVAGTGMPFSFRKHLFCSKKHYIEKRPDCQANFNFSRNMRKNKRVFCQISMKRRRSAGVRARSSAPARSSSCSPRNPQTQPMVCTPAFLPV